MTKVPTVKADLLVDARAMIGEGPVWDSRNGCLLWIDIAAGAIHAFDPRDATAHSIGLGQPIGSLGLRAGGGLVVALRDGFGILEADTSVPLRLIDVEKDRSANRMNEGKVDSQGRFWAGTMAVDHTRGQGSLYRFQEGPGRGYEVARMVGDITIANGLDWSLDNRTLYYIDSATQRIDRFDFDPHTGDLSNRCPLIEIPPREGLPDGMTVDAEGHIWVALFRAGIVRRYSPSGKAEMQVVLPASLVTSCAFGGREFDELYITTARHRLSPEEAASQPTAGGLFVCRPGPVGRPPFLFGQGS